MYLQFHKTSFFPRLPQIARLSDCPAPIAIIVKETRVSENFVGMKKKTSHKMATPCP